MSRIPKVDAYIAKSPELARPILERIREAFHAASPDVEEAMKWSTPHFVRGGILGGMAAFKQHVRFGFWRGMEMKDPAGLFESVGNTQMGMVKVHSLSELPPRKVLVAYVKEAIALEDARAAAPARGKAAKKAARKAARPAPAAPPDLLAALKKNKRALAAYESFSPTHKREYVEWITEAKRPETRQKRLAQAIEWIAESKPRNWKYMKR